MCLQESMNYDPSFVPQTSTYFTSKTKPMPTPSITQQVIKYCEMGFFPICKLQNGQYQTFTPFKDDDDNFSCSIPSYNLDTAKRAVTEAWRDFNHIDEKQTPTEIIGFYHPGFKPFEVGDKVTVIGEINESPYIPTVVSYDSDNHEYGICYGSYNPVYYRHWDLEPYLEPSQETAQSQTTKIKLQDMKVGDILINENGQEIKVLAVSGLIFMPSLSKNHSQTSTCWYSFEEAENDGWKFK